MPMNSARVTSVPTRLKSGEQKQKPGTIVESGLMGHVWRIDFESGKPNGFFYGF